MSPVRPLHRSPALWALVALFATEFFLFDHFGARRFTGVYPRWNDQIQYLSESYAAYEHARAHGFLSGLWQTLANTSAQGTLHDFFALILFQFAGPSRSAALALNLLALVAWQASLFFAVTRASGQRALGIAAAMLPLALLGPWQDIPGSAYDFRLDHLAMCAFGITASCAWLTDRFQSRSGSVLFGISVGLTLLTRFLTGTYFVVIFAGLLVWVLTSSGRKQGTLNLLLSALVAFLLAAPVFWINLATIRDYYWIGHYVGPESAIRDPNLSTAGSLRFIGDHLLYRHLGWVVVIVAAAGAVALALARRISSPTEKSSTPAAPSGWPVGLLFFLGPGLILFLHKQKSEVVVSALVPGLLVLAAASWVALSRRVGPALVVTFAGLVTLVAFIPFNLQQRSPAFPPETLAEIRRVNSLADEIVGRTRRADRQELRVGVDYITDALDAQVLRVISYERHRVWLTFHMTLPTGIFEPDEGTVMQRLAESDFVFLTVDAPEGRYPFDHKLAKLRPQLTTWCEQHLRVANEFTLGSRRMRLYQKRELPFP